MPYLNWIDDKKLEDHVMNLYNKSVSSKRDAKSRFYDNVIDPFSALFQMAGFDLDYKEWIKAEEARQAQKTLQNFVGDFHQNVLGDCHNWSNLGVGNIMDLVNPSERIIAEVKNKYNTISGGKLSDLYYDMDRLVEPKSSMYKGFTAYLVQIIPKNCERYDEPFAPSDKNKGKKCSVNKLIRVSDGASFYALATGDSDALKDLYQTIPTILNKKLNLSFDKKGLEDLYDRAFG